MERDQYTHMISLKERDLKDLLTKQGKMEEKDVQRISTPPTEGNMATGDGIFSELVSTLTSVTKKWREYMREVVDKQRESIMLLEQRCAERRKQTQMRIETRLDRLRDQIYENSQCY